MKVSTPCGGECLGLDLRLSSDLALDAWLKASGLLPGSLYPCGSLSVVSTAWSLERAAGSGRAR